MSPCHWHRASQGYWMLSLSPPRLWWRAAGQGAVQDPPSRQKGPEWRRGCRSPQEVAAAVPFPLCYHPQWRWSLAQQGPSAIPAGTGPKGEKGEKGERGPKGDSGTSGILGTGATKGEKVSKGLLGLPLSPVCSSVFTFDSHLSPFLFHRGRKVNWASR